MSKWRKVREVGRVALSFLFFLCVFVLVWHELFFALCMNFIFVNISFVVEVKCV